MLEKKEIFFNPELHKYTDEHNNVYTSVTQLIHKIVPTFDKRYWLMYTSLKESGYYLRPDLQNQNIIINGKTFSIDNLYKGIVKLKKSIQDINDEWDKINKESCEKGTAIHEQLENNINLITGNFDNKLNNLINENKLQVFKSKQIVDVKDLPLDIRKKYPKIIKRIQSFLFTGYEIYTEVRVYHPIYYIAGTIDLLIIKDKQFYILDWKTNKDDLHFISGYYKKENNIKTNKFIANDERLLSPLNNLQNCKGIIYTLQLSLYSFILEEWGYECLDLELYHIRDTINVHNLNYLKEEIKTLLNFHKKNLNLKNELNFDKNILKQINFDL